MRRSASEWFERMTSAHTDRFNNYQHLLSVDQFDQLQQACARPLAPALRVNTLKIDLATARSTWPIEYGWHVQPVPFCEAGWRITGNAESLSRTIEHRTGFYYLQDAASMLPAEMFGDAIEFPLILDMAASPGGKTTHLAAKIDDRGVILANDSSSGRIAALRSNVQTWGSISTALTSYPGERFGEWFPNTFDRVLLDAPCSGESLRTAERRKTRFVSQTERLQLQRRQIKLLESAFHAVRPGGQIVYSTCTLAPEEDEAVLDALLRQYPQQFVIESVERMLPMPAPAVTRDGDREFHPDVRNAVRLWPHLYDTSGFFAALIRKQGATTGEGATSPERSRDRAGFKSIAEAQRRAVVSQLLNTYEFNLDMVVERQRLELLQRSDSVYAVPEQLLTSFEGFPCIAIGMLIGEWHESIFVPSHELIARFSSQFASQRFTLTGDQVKTWLNGGDLRGVDVSYPVGSIVVMEDDRHRYIGRGKVLRERVRNLLPRH
jgi:16S rRNA (cytosine1407-C5)-methyltransferase